MYVMHYLCKLGLYGCMLPVYMSPTPGYGFPLLSVTMIFFPHTSCHFPNLARFRTEDGGNIFLQSIRIRLPDVHGLIIQGTIQISELILSN